jgi:hypothetical protein
VEMTWYVGTESGGSYRMRSTKLNPRSKVDYDVEIGTKNGCDLQASHGSRENCWNCL